MLGRLSAVPMKAFVKSPPLILSKAFAGKLVSDEQPYHALEKSVPSEVSIKGKLSSDEQPYHAAIKVVPLEVLINGNSVISE